LQGGEEDSASISIVMQINHGLCRGKNVKNIDLVITEQEHNDQ